MLSSSSLRYLNSQPKKFITRTFSYETLTILNFNSRLFSTTRNLRNLDQDQSFTNSSIIQSAYDQAKILIDKDSRKLNQLLNKINLKTDSDYEAEEKLQKLEINSQINNYEIRKLHRSSKGDLSKLIFRFLLEKEWRENGRLGRLMETVYRLRIFPDILPALDPQVDLKITHESAKENLNKSVTVGSFIPSSKLEKPPIINAQVFHPEPKLYTLVMIDPDVPDPSNKTYQTFLHWLIPNVSISATSPKPLPLSALESIPYIPPHPSQGSDIHRYTIMLLLQETEIPLPDANSRLGFSLRTCSKQYGLTPVGVFSWISKWTSADAQWISSVYRDQLKIFEPRYGREPKPWSSHNRLPPNSLLPLSHRHPPVIPWRTLNPDTS